MSVGIAFIPAITPNVGAQAIAVKMSMIEATSWLNTGGLAPIPKMIRNTTGTTPRTGTDWKMSRRGKSTCEARWLIAVAIPYVNAKPRAKAYAIVIRVSVRTAYPGIHNGSRGLLLQFGDSPPVSSSIIKATIATAAIPLRNILVKKETVLPAEDEATRFLRLCLDTCKMNPIQYS